MLSVNISNIAIITVKNNDYCCKSEAINLLKKFLKIVGIYKKYCLKLQSLQDSFS